MKHRIPVLILSLLSCISLSAGAATPKASGGSSGAILVTVNGKAVPAARADALLADQQRQGRGLDDKLRADVKEELIRREVVAQEAQKMGLDKNPDFLNELEMMRQQMLVRAYVIDYVKAHPVSDQDVKKEYDAQLAQAGGKEYKVRHILVKTEERAKELIGKLQSGAKFDELAKESEDPGTKDRGGDLDWLLPANLPKPLMDAVVKTEKGKFSATPVQGPAGFHIFRVDDIRDWKAPSLDEVKAQLQQRLQMQAVERKVVELRKAAKVQ
ncbi:MAG: peptidyl-prolyl cis-trans isomerase [Rhodocyclaceae bacterium]|nr:peptidyl-prolyl cis-trans isomerase [Rhodocyclaceae bacterium]MBX3670529.1 peptidyl-prolyl cis-trans isomerase [Rhodocyclaceae bacterium]